MPGRMTPEPPAQGLAGTEESLTKGGMRTLTFHSPHQQAPQTQSSCLGRATASASWSVAPRPAALLPSHAYPARPCPIPARLSHPLLELPHHRYLGSFLAACHQLFQWSFGDAFLSTGVDI